MPNTQQCLLAAVLVLAGCARTAEPPPVDDPAAPSPSAPPSTTSSLPPVPHTEGDRLALFDHLVSATLRRHAFSDRKTAALQLDFERDATALRDGFRTAETDLELFRAVARLSAVRRDAHMEVAPIPGGLAVDAAEYASGLEFAPDFERLDERAFCLQRVADNIAPAQPTPQVGDILVSINGQSPTDFEHAAAPYLLYSTLNGRAWALARAFGTQPAWWPTLPPAREFVYRLRNSERGEYELSLPGLIAADLNWPPLPGRNFPGFVPALSLPSFELYRPADGQRIVAFAWKAFGKEDLEGDLEQLVAYASGNQLFDHDVIVDFTHSRGGADAVLALQILLPRPFKTTFGDLRISDVIDPFITSREASPRLRGWLHNDVRAAQQRGDPHTAPVPFKLRHLPADSDGILHPAPRHFTGRMVALFGSQVGSQVDQVAAMLIDNAACHTIGMPTGGYSNTWAWEENVAIPTTGRPIAQFVWSMGRTFRPNGEELEGNPPVPADLVLLTCENVADYHDQLLNRAVAYLTDE